jgi:hypothetical protein
VEALDFSLLSCLDLALPGLVWLGGEQKRLTSELLGTKINALIIGVRIRITSLTNFVSHAFSSQVF